MKLKTLVIAMGMLVPGMLAIPSAQAAPSALLNLEGDVTQDSTVEKATFGWWNGERRRHGSYRRYRGGQYGYEPTRRFYGYRSNRQGYSSQRRGESRMMQRRQRDVVR